MSEEVKRQKVYDQTVISDEDSCWIWVGAMSGSGYGVVTLAKRDQPYAHRLSYEIHHGPIPPGMNICHTCDNKVCVNPSHLFAGTQNDNVQDMVQKGRHVHGERTITAILTEHDVKEIRQLREEGHTLQHIADQYGISFQQVSRIVRRERWAHVA